MRPKKSLKLLSLILTLVVLVMLITSCQTNEEDSPPESQLETVGTLMANSPKFTHFAQLITIADTEIPNGEKGIMQMLSDTEGSDQVTVFAPSNEVFELLAQAWSSSDFQASIEDVIAEFTHNGQPAKTRDFLLGHIFFGNKEIKASEFSENLTLESKKGIRWRMVATNAISGFGFVLDRSSSNNNPYEIYETDVLIGSNGIVTRPLVN